MTDETRAARRDDVTQIITAALDDYQRADTRTDAPDALADVIVAALEEAGVDFVWREQREQAQRD